MKHSLSIIVPVFNVELYIKDCLESVINQTKLPSEIILIDDGSTDSSGIICDSYVMNFPNLFRVIHQKNAGLSEARNRGIEKSKCDYVLFLDSDDTLSKNAIEQITSLIDFYKPEVLVGSITSKWPDGDVNKVHSTKDGTRTDGPDFLEFELKRKTMFYEAVHAVYKRSFLVEKELNFMPGLLHEDQLFTTRVFLAAADVLVTKLNFYNHIIRENSISTQKDKTNNAKSIIHICYEEEKLCSNIENVSLQSLILDHCVDLYYRVYIDAKLIGKKEIRIKKDFLRKYSKSKKNKARTILYFLNERLFTKIEGKRRNIG